MNSNRRKFIKTSTFATASIGVFPGIMSACQSANEKIVVGLVGCRGMGFSNLKAFLNQPNVECGALCDVDRNVLAIRAEEVEKIQGKKPLLYDDFRYLIDNKDINAVINGTPDHWHALITIYACEAGKDVYTEKPLAHTIEECNLIVKAQKRYGRIIQVGQHQRSAPHWGEAVNYLHKGNIGRIRSVHSWIYYGGGGALPKIPNSDPPDGVNYDMWLGPAPQISFNKNRFHWTWRWYWDYAGGLMTDWGVHLLDYALFGMNRYVPKSVMATGGKYAFPDDDMQTPDTLIAVYDFGDFSILWEHTLGINGANFGKGGHGVAYVGEYGTLVISRNGWEVIPEKRSKCAKEGYEGISFKKSSGGGLNFHVENFLKCIKTREKPNCDVEIGAHIARISHLGNISYRLGRKIFWDDEKQEFIEDTEANEMIKAYYRTPWELPKL
jgi:predicted dehydrogenase